MAGLKLLLTMASAVLLAGCAASAIEQDYGQSVRQIVEAQKAHPEISRNPDPAYVDGSDANRISAAVKTYQSDVAKPADVKQDIVLKIGGGQ